ncbi:peptidase S10 serine carboxypeptidase domain protein [Burkholderia pseudomallei MSHR684]|nr:peptidase S10 serine carboxypeptidase domain protein [Burkholderia pseudomallei MSHR684]
MPVELHARRLEQVREHVGARRAVRFPEQVLRRIVALIHLQIADHEIAKCSGILIDAPERLVRVRRDRLRETGADRVDEHEIGRVEERFLVVDERERRRAVRVRIARHEALGPERAEMQPDRRRARPAVVEKRDGPLAERLIVGRVRDIEERRFGGAALRVARAQVAGGRGVVDRLAVHRDLVMRDRGVLGHRGRRQRSAAARRITVGIPIGLVRAGRGIDVARTVLARRGARGRTGIVSVTRRDQQRREYRG